MKYLRLLIGILLVLMVTTAAGQSDSLRVTADYHNLPFLVFIKKASDELNVRFFYPADSVPDIRMKVLQPPADLLQVLRVNLEPAGFFVSMDRNGNVFVNRGQAIATRLPDNFFSLSQKSPADTERNTSPAGSEKDFLRTNNEYIARTFTIGNRKAGARYASAAIGGQALSFNDSTPLPGATLYIEELQRGAVSGEDGSYQLEVPKGKYTVVVRSIGYEESWFKVEVLSAGDLDFYLLKKVFLMETVEISSEAEHNVKSVQMGMEKLSLKDIKEIPTVLGERDIIRVALLLPGVQSVGEGAAGFNVRGSPADQNLFVIGGIPVYNTSHLFGFFSAFNPDIVSDFTLYKSSIPAQYGGRLSSIFDIKPLQGNREKFAARGGISPITARIMAEGPVIKDKLSYMAGFRSTYSDWVLNFIDVPEIKNSSGNFGDAALNLYYNLNNKNQIKIFGYYSYDQSRLAAKVDNSYQNAGAALSWFHSLSAKHSFDASLVYSSYTFSEDNYEYFISAYRDNYQLEHQQASLNFLYQPTDAHTLRYGATTILYNIDRGNHLPLNDASLVTPVDLGTEKGLESALFVSDEWKATPLLTLAGGLRYNHFAALGPSTVFQYTNGAPKIPENITDTLFYNNNQISQTYQGLDLRLAATYLLNENISIKAGFNNLHQYIFMLSNTIAISPVDKWQLSNSNIEPMRGEQYSLGIYTNLARQLYEFSVEGYYKKVHNLVEYRDGAELVVNQYPEQDVLQGKLDAWGIEVMLRKPYGKLNGWINYTWSNTSVLVDNKITGEQNNFGIAYPANYDKPHAVNLVVNYKISKRISFSGNVVYATGRPITYPTSIYYQDGQKILNYSLRNEYRIPDYFRTDISLKVEGNLRKRKWLHGAWIFSVYNLTGRKNAYSVYFKNEEGSINSYKLSIFAVPIFSVTYDFKLGNYAD